MARVNTFAGRGGVLHGGAGGHEPPRQPGPGRQLPPDAPPIYEEAEQEQGQHHAVSLEELLSRPDTRDCPWVDPYMDGALW